MFAGGKSLDVVDVIWDREVRRCYKCQCYGHLAKFCTAATPVCGRCAGNHDTKECSGDATLKCSNCGEGHRAGDPKCRIQAAAVKKLKGRTQLTRKEHIITISKDLNLNSLKLHITLYCSFSSLHLFNYLCLSITNHHCHYDVFRSIFATRECWLP